MESWDLVCRLLFFFFPLIGYSRQKQGPFNQSASQLPCGETGTAEKKPAGPEDDEKHGVSAAQDEDGKFVKDPGADFLHASGVPDVGNGFGGHGECVLENECGGDKGIEEDMFAGI
ncbi:uncharacterized protein TrAFT101_002091 [Trichoderma asperellum]|uniref:uncharacterized protein n=1 Tax=Trichoderma asperellum TaxID=101201 RepID=UPI00331AC89C|nr:hypothetical protein TrAFT101_002091 [Trichoderma asperellum]